MLKKRLKKRLKNTSLKRKMLLFYILSFILPLVILNIVIYREISESMIEKIRYSSRQSYEQTNDYLEYRILQAIYLSDVVVTNREVKDALVREEATVFQQLAMRESLRRTLQSIEGSRQYLHIQLYMPDVLSEVSDGSYIFPESEAENEAWYTHKGGDRVYFSPDIYLEEENAGRQIALVRDVVSESDYNHRIGILRINIDVKDLRDTLKNASVTEHAVTYLINSENIMIAASEEVLMAEHGSKEGIPEFFSYSEYQMNRELQKAESKDGDVYYMRDRIQNTDWEMVTVIPASDMLEDVVNVQRIMLVIMGIFMILTITGGTAIISWICRRIEYLVSSMKVVQEGNLDIHLENDCEDEIGVLYDNYNKMIRSTSELMEEKYQMGLMLKSAELKALQFQINPHFLYNTLDAINWLARAGRGEEISSAVIALSKYYRLVLNKGADVLTLENELNHVGYYIRLQELRYPGRIKYVQDVPPGILNGMIPKIILQPLVENAIMHGIFERRGKQGTIRITGCLENEEIICLKVIDDGAGMDEETLSHILDGSIRSSGSSYGVRNVNARIALMFGEEYGLTYESAPNQGTTVTIRFPKRESL